MGVQLKDDALWQLAKKRAAFKMSLVVYIFVNLFLMSVWYFASGTGSYFWPVWPILGWGLGIVLQYFDAFYGNRIFSASQEYEKLKKQNQI